MSIRACVAGGTSPRRKRCAVSGRKGVRGRRSNHAASSSSDDVRTGLHELNKTDIPFSIENKNVILIDDVLWTGRTIRAAIGALFDYGRPGRIELAVLVDRGCRELPIQPDYCGLRRHIGPESYLRVSLRELDGHDGLFIMPAKSGDRPPDAPA